MQPTTIAKITRPVLGEILVRENLLQQLDDCTRQQLIWITGPGGSGKTTLVNTYIETRKPDYIWYRIDRSDDDPASFFNFLAQASVNAHPDMEMDLPAFNANLLFSVNWFSRQFFTSLAAHFKSPAVLVLDNFQALSEASPIHSALLESLNRLPAGLGIMVISRREPPPSFARLRANGVMALMDWKDLRLSQEEFAEIMRMRGQTSIFSETVRQDLYDRLDGWAGGLSLLLDAARHGNFDPVLQGTATPSAFFDYFASEIFLKMAEPLSTFILKISVFPEVTAKMAAALTGAAEPEKLLEELLANNHFTEKRPVSPPVYLFHPLFLEFLNRQAAERFTAEELELLLKQAASILVAAGRLDEGAALLTRAGAWPELEELIVARAPELFAHGKNILLLSWIKSMPEARVEKSGWLLYWMGMCLCPFAPPESRVVLNKAYAIFKSGQNPIEMVMSWCAVELIHFVDCSDYSPLDGLIEDVFKFLPRVKDHLPDELSAMLGFHIFSALNMRQPQHPQMAIYADQVDQLIDIIPDISQRLTMAARQMLHRATQGELQKAARLMSILGPLARDKTIAPFPKLNWVCAEVIYAVITADFKGCLAIAAEGEKMSRESEVQTTEATILSMAVFALLGQGKYRKAEADLARMEKAIMPGRFFEYALHRLQEALCFALQGEPGKALETAKVALDMVQQSGSPLLEPYIRFAIGQLYTDTGNYSAAADELAQAGNLGRDFNSPLAECLSCLYGAQLQFAQGSEGVGLELLRKGLGVGRENRYFWLFWDRHDVMASLCARALQADIETEYVREFIQKRGLVPEEPPVAIENWPWPIRIYTLGRFELVCDGSTLPATGKRQQKPLALLKALLAMGGRSVADERIADFLWPDADGDFQVLSLKTTLHRLRKLLGHNEAIIFQNHQLSLNPDLCWTDIWAFEHCVDGTGKKDHYSGDIIYRIEKGLELYKGPFMGQNGDEPWVLSPRERYRSMYLRMIEQAAKLQEDKSQWDAAISLYEKALATEPLIEEFYQRMMICYQQANRPAEASAVYQRCCNELTSGLGIETSEKTKAIYRGLQLLNPKH